MNNKHSFTNELKSLGIFKDFVDGSIKSVFQTSKKGIIELTLLFNKPEFDVICAPTHHFCNLGCKMCHLTNNSLNKQMTPILIEDFMEALIKSLCSNKDVFSCHPTHTNKSISKRTCKKKLLISFMGVGEPLLNLKLIEDVYTNEVYIKDILGYEEISYALATMMPNNNIESLIECVSKYNIPLKLHFSMHSPIDAERFELIPSARIDLRHACEYLVQYRNVATKNSILMEVYKKFHRTCDPIEIHYTLIKGRNDSLMHLNETIKLLKEYRIPIKFIRFNPIAQLERSDMEDMWINSIRKEIPDVRVKAYSPPGREIGSSCGEFTKHYYHEEIETKDQYDDFKKWELKHQIYENNRKDYLSWDAYYMGLAILSAQRSKDPSTQVGACIINADNRILSIGYNGTPNGIRDEAFNWERCGDFGETKYAYVIHAEANAILNYHGNAKDLCGATLYVTLFPCNECAKLIVQCGIKKVIYLSDRYHDRKEIIAAKKIFDLCEIEYHKYNTSGGEIILNYEQ